MPGDFSSVDTPTISWVLYILVVIINYITMDKTKASNIISGVIGIGLLFGTVWLVSRAWKIGQK